MKIYTHHPPYHKTFRRAQKLLRLLNLLGIFFDMIFSFHSGVSYRFLNDRGLLRVIRDKVPFQSSVRESSPGSPVIDSSLGWSVFFFGHVAICLNTLHTLFAVTRCHSLSFVVIRHLLHHSLTLVFIWCTFVYVFINAQLK